MRIWLHGVTELICAIDLATGHPITNPNSVIGQQIAIVILPAPAPFLTETGLKIFGPKYAGL